MKSLTKSLKDIGFLTIALTLALAANFAYGQWSNPPAAAPGSNVAAPVNVGGDPQNKSGTFGAGSLNSFVITANTQMRSPRYCDENGLNCVAQADLGGTPPPTSVPTPPVCTGSEKALQWNGSSWNCSSVGSTGPTPNDCSPTTYVNTSADHLQIKRVPIPSSIPWYDQARLFQCQDGNWFFILEE